MDIYSKQNDYISQEHIEQARHGRNVWSFINTWAAQVSERIRMPRVAEYVSHRILV